MTDPLAQSIQKNLRTAFGANTDLLAVVPLAGDASSRRYYRARLRGFGAPPSLIVMELPAGAGLPLSSEELAIFKDGLPEELPFLNVHRFLEAIGVRVPKLYGHGSGEGILLLEDLGDTALWDRVQGLGAAETLSWYRKAIDEMLTLQVRGTRARDEACIAFRQRFDRRLYLWEFEHFIEWGLVKRPGAKPFAALDALRNCFCEIAEFLDRQETCLNHRDYHSWNLLVRDDSVYVIDFQDALLAPPSYDLASLLNDRVTDSVVHPELEEELVQYYIGRRSELERGAVETDRFREMYRLSAIQRDLKVVGRFYYLDLVKNKPGYRRFIPPTVRRLMRKLHETGRGREILALLEKDFEAML